MNLMTDVILIFSPKEHLNESSYGNVPPLQNINSWLKNHCTGIYYAKLVNMDIAQSSDGRVMLNEVYGGSFYRLNVEVFIDIVQDQAWREPENVQLLIQNDTEKTFTIYNIT